MRAYVHVRTLSGHLALLPVQGHGELVVTDEVSDELEVRRDHLACVVHLAFDAGAHALLEGDDFFLLIRGFVVGGRGTLLVVAVLACDVRSESEARQKRCGGKGKGGDGGE